MEVIEVIKKWFASTKIKLYGSTRINPHNRIQDMIQQFWSQILPAVSEKSAIESEEDATGDVVDPTSHRISDPKRRPKSCTATGMKRSPIISMITKTERIPTGHTRMDVKCFRSETDHHAFRCGYSWNDDYIVVIGFLVADLFLLQYVDLKVRNHTRCDI
jgi:hypothetical protein